MHNAHPAFVRPAVPLLLVLNRYSLAMLAQHAESLMQCSEPFECTHEVNMWSSGSFRFSIRWLDIP